MFMGGDRSRLFHPVKTLQNWSRKRKVMRWYNKMHQWDFDKLPKAKEKLGKIDHPLALFACVDLLKHGYPEVRLWAAEQIALKKEYLADKRIKKEIYDRFDFFLSSPEYHIREATVDALGKLNTDETINAIGVVLDSERDNSVIIRAIDVLGECENRKAHEILRQMLKIEKFTSYREEIRKALGIPF